MDEVPVEDQQTSLPIVEPVFKERGYQPNSWSLRGIRGRNSTQPLVNIKFAFGLLELRGLSSLPVRLGGAHLAVADADSPARVLFQYCHLGQCGGSSPPSLPQGFSFVSNYVYMVWKRDLRRCLPPNPPESVHLGLRCRVGTR